jgi:parallel beta-helix repeat protein
VNRSALADFARRSALLDMNVPGAPPVLRRNLRLLLLLLTITLTHGVARVEAQHVLRDDMTGGDCEPGGFGVWSPTAKSCTLVVDLQGTLELASDGLTLDGGGHEMTPRPGDATGVRTAGRSGATITNLVLRDFQVGVEIKGGASSRILGTTVRGGPMGGPGALCGIHLDGTTGNEVDDNTVEDGNGSGICLSASHRNRLKGNRVRRQRSVEIELTSSDENRIYRNDLTAGPGQRTQGVTLFASRNNAIAANTIAGYGGGAIELVFSDLQRVFFNTLTNSAGGGVLVTGDDNLVFCNDSSGNPLGFDVAAASARNLFWMNNLFAADTARDRAGRVAGIRFELPAPAGGNHWRVNAPFCVNANGDAFCDAPFPFLGNQDNLPWEHPVPWRLLPEICFLQAPPPPPSTPPPPIDAAWAAETFALLRDFEHALAAGDVAGLAARLDPEAVLLDGVELVTGKPAILERLVLRASCGDRTTRLRPLAIPRAANDDLLSLAVEPCDGKAFRIVARAESATEPPGWRLRRILIEPLSDR